ncbi:unnamed protein product [Malus baccata var. baccata]
MAIKVCVISFLLTSVLFSLLYIPTRLKIPIHNFKPVINYFNLTTISNTSNTKPYPVTFAYLISASKGDSMKLKRMLYALYHPGNYYLIHMDYGAPEDEHRDIADFVAGDPVFGQVGNVWILGKPNLVTYRGPTMLATTLHALSLLLRTWDWDWFINLSASDYPLITQDDMIHAFSDLPRDLNFIQHTSRLGWKLNKRGKPMIIDPGLYSLNKSELWWVIKQRALPTAFKLYTGLCDSSYLSWEDIVCITFLKNMLWHFCSLHRTIVGWTKLLFNTPHILIATQKIIFLKTYRQHGHKIFGDIARGYCRH